ncbi:MBL fold metallo-hydrolase [Bacillus sp. BGMRC 2118]|nr:MBL fold metallo-hydrolase [Bacillus sp. BGMRC 2118]
MSNIETPFFTLQEICHGVYAAVAKKGEGAWSNSGFVDLGTELVVFDSFSTPAAAKELRNIAEKITGKKVKYLVNSHYHGDHVFGNQVFEDTTILSTSKTRNLFIERNVLREIEEEKEEMSAYLQDLRNQMENSVDEVISLSIQNQYNEMKKVYEALHELKMVYPTVTFEEKLVIHGTERDAHLYALGGGHTPCDTIMYVPQEKVAFMGDLITDGIHFPIYNPIEFISILTEAKSMDIETVIPGHGQVNTMNAFDTVIQYITDIVEQAKDAIQLNKSMNDFQSSFIIRDLYKDWLGQSGVYRNVESVYEYLKENLYGA